MIYQWKACHNFRENTEQSYLSSSNPLVFHFHKCEEWDEMDNKQYILWNINEWWSYKRWMRWHNIIQTVTYRWIQLILSNVFSLMCIKTWHLHVILTCIMSGGLDVMVLNKKWGLSDGGSIKTIVIGEGLSIPKMWGLLICRSKITTVATVNDSIFIIEDRTQGNFQTINRLSLVRPLPLQPWAIM